MIEDGETHQNQNFFNKSQEYLNKINQLISDVQHRISLSFRKAEGNRLQEYKEKLLKTKAEFEGMHENRNDDNITRNIFSMKKDLEKECSVAFEMEMEASRAYQKLKESLSLMNSQESELKLEIDYLKKQCISTETRGEKLLEELKEKQRYYEELSNKDYTEDDGKENDDLLTIHSEVLKKKENRDKYLKESKERLKNKIEVTKQYLDSLIFLENPLESNFSAYPLEDCRTNKQKLKLIEEIFSKKEFKKLLHSLLFHQ